VSVEIFRLAPHRLFPTDAEPGEVLVDRLLELRPATRRVDILDAQQEPRAQRMRHLAIDQRGQRMPEMEVSVRAWRKTENGRLHGSSPAGLTRGSIMNESSYTTGDGLPG